MPLVKVEILKGKSTDYKQAILDGIHSALTETFQVPPNKRNQRLYELDKEDFQFPSDKSDQYTLIQLTVITGRSPETKEKLYRKIVTNLKASPRIEEHDITIAVYELPPENWKIFYLGESK